ncbi:hypothetical protein KAU19_01230 [Candidatus Parcubacteria bacterium]|nr:hypothetical protein [Candidatus Parcubacteria bacterium]
MNEEKKPTMKEVYSQKYETTENNLQTEAKRKKIFIILALAFLLILALITQGSIPPLFSGGLLGLAIAILLLLYKAH